jgi:Skp family chaperone for outer membrane proteins
MNTRAWGIASFSILYAASFGFAQAPKIAIVNVAKIFDGLDEAKMANDTLKTRTTGYRAKAQLMALNERELIRAYKENQQKLKTADDAVKAALASDLKVRAKMIQSHRNDRNAHVKSANRDISTYSNRVRSSLLTKIRAAIKEVATTEKLDYVFDVSGVTSTNVPAIVYTSNTNDLTEAVSKYLNDQLKAQALDAPAEKTETPQK